MGVPGGMMYLGVCGGVGYEIASLGATRVRGTAAGGWRRRVS